MRWTVNNSRIAASKISSFESLAIIVQACDTARFSYVKNLHYYRNGNFNTRSKISNVKTSIPCVEKCSQNMRGLIITWRSTFRDSYEIKQAKLRALYVTAALCSSTMKGTSRILQHDWLYDFVFLCAVINHKTESWTTNVCSV